MFLKNSKPNYIEFKRRYHELSPQNSLHQMMSRYMCESLLSKFLKMSEINTNKL